MGIYWYAGGGAPFTIPANKVWFALEKSTWSEGKEITGFTLDENGDEAEPVLRAVFADGQVSQFVISDKGETTGIESVEAQDGESGIYSIAGQRVNEMNRRGVYIVGGKKVLKR